MATHYKPLVVCFFLLLSWLPVKGQDVGLLLGTFVSDRWYLDQKLFSDRVEQLGGQTSIELSYTHEDQLSRARKMIAEGIDVMVLVPIDGQEAGEIAALCKQAGVPLISYDRLVLSNDISAYLSYDSEQVGKLQASYCIGKVPKGKYLLISGPANDYNSMLLRKGQMSELGPLIERGDIDVNKIITHQLSLSRAEDLKTLYGADAAAIKTVMLCS